MKNRLVLSVLGWGAVIVFFWGCASEQMTSARLYIQQQEWQKAEEMLLSASQFEPDNPEIYFLLGKEIYSRKKQWDRVNEMFEKSYSLGADKKIRGGVTVKEAIEKARTQFWGEYHNEGVQHYNRAVQEKDDTLGMQDALHLAVKSFETAIKIKPDEPNTYRNLVYGYIQLGYMEEVEEKLSEALEKNPDDVDLLVTAGKIALDNQDSEKAVDYLEKAMSLDSRNVTVIRLLAEAYYRAGDTEGAIFAYTKAIRHDPSNADLLFNLGLLYMQLGDHDLAGDKFQEVLKLNPDDLQAVVGIASAYEQMEKWKDAEFYYRQSLAKDPDNNDVKRSLARVVYRQGRLEEAEKILQQVYQEESQKK